ncbi:MAG: TonB-dependent receptor plug domain-containing protein [Myxococcaceae bacterium]
MTVEARWLRLFLAISAVPGFAQAAPSSPADAARSTTPAESASSSADALDAGTCVSAPLPPPPIIAAAAAAADAGVSPPMVAEATADAGISPSTAEAPLTAAPTTPMETVVRGSAQRPVSGWRISGRELSRRGADTLADALALLPNVRIRLGGRGEIRFDMRAARPGSIRVLVDGVPMEEPYLGRFDPASVPVSDVVQIRVDPAPMSPVDGPGGAGGVVEVETLRATGPWRVEGRARAGLPLDGMASATGRYPFSDTAGIRLSAAVRGIRDRFFINKPDGGVSQFPVTGSLAQAGLRLEGELKSVQLAADFAAYHRCFWAAPGQDSTQLQHVCAQDAARGILRAKISEGAWKGSVSAYALLLGREADFYASPETTDTVTSTEAVKARRLGGDVRVERALNQSWRLIIVDSVQYEGADYNLGTSPTSGSGLVMEPAAAVVYQDNRLRGEASVGGAIPFGSLARPWPEAKGTVAYRPFQELTLTANVGRKGRLPTLRERFEPGTGNPDVGPEIFSYVDFEAYYQNRWFSPRVAAFHRWMDGLIQRDPSTTSLLVTNVAHLQASGVEAAFSINNEGMFSGGAAYGLTLSTAPIENQAKHHGEIYARFQMTNIGALARLRYVGTRPEGGAELDPYALFDVSAWYQLARRLRLTLRADNLFDTHFQYRKNLLSNGRWLGLALEFTLG